MTRTAPTSLITALLGSLAVACGGTTYDYSGHNMDGYFPLDGVRSWEYVQEDVSFEWVMQVEKMSGSYEVDNAEVFTLEYAKKDPFELLYSVDWSSDSTNGILIHGYHLEGADAVSYDPPVVFADYQMSTDDQVVTDTGGVSFTATLVDVENCPNEWTSDEWECLHMSLDDHGAELPFSGDYWITTGWGTSWFKPTGFDDKWILNNALWDPEST